MLSLIPLFAPSPTIRLTTPKQQTTIPKSTQTVPGGTLRVRGLTKYCYVLWYNFLNQKIPDTNINKRLILIKNNLKPTEHMRELRELVILDMHFDFEYRCVPLEYELLKILLCNRNPAPEMIDCWYTLWEKITNIGTIYEFVFSKQNEIAQFLNNASINDRGKQTCFKNWYKFVTCLLNKCEIEPNVSIAALDALNGVKKELMSLVATLFARHIENMRNDDTSKWLYNLLMQYPILLTQNVRQAILNNDSLSSQPKFVPFFYQLLRRKKHNNNHSESKENGNHNYNNNDNNDNKNELASFNFGVDDIDFELPLNSLTFSKSKRDYDHIERIVFYLIQICLAHYPLARLSLSEIAASALAYSFLATKLHSWVST